MHMLRKQRKSAGGKSVLSADLLYAVLRASGHQRHAHPWILALQEKDVEAMLRRDLCVPVVMAYQHTKLKNGEFRNIPCETRVSVGSRYSLYSTGEFVDIEDDD